MCKVVNTNQISKNIRANKTLNKNKANKTQKLTQTVPTGRAVPPATRIREVRAAVIASFSPHIGASFTFVHLNRELLVSSHFLARHQAVKLTQIWRVDYPSVRRKETRYSCTSKLLYTIDVLTGLFLPILGTSHFFFSWEFFHRLSKVVSYWVKNY